MIILKGRIPEPLVMTYEVQDPEELARGKEMHERFWRNVNWLQNHWHELLPDAFGKFVVVAGEEPFLADTPEEAWAKAKAAHPEDKAPYGKYVRKGRPLIR